MNTPKSQFYQASSTGRFQFKFKPSVEIGGFPSLTPCHSDKSASKLDWFGGPSDLLGNPYFILQLEKQKKHCTSKESLHHEDLSIGKRTFIQANKETDGLVSLEDIMQRKSRVPTLQKKRNLQDFLFNLSIPLHYLGDKNYPYPEIDSNFYKQNDGLVAGSNIKSRIRHPYKVSKKFHG
ncbi:unnamed protein product (macronuclear) [Paramecium tetraurelia]|uniref:Uncharacterized protein n=1 Tax=Paramecium tetraurelia TaxID=5888 RepID=A0BE20_PARTE|nr:uncharacterized protein GSPATT00027819001 [Paramecium tetraurelia]CAK56787.1 unnamed protein product [Paramecium tetraurelia]|eukprot:XP_001424185.1 hypothetical protein (macronuclear) [Paramecium tetraurelia strain d4-2]